MRTELIAVHEQILASTLQEIPYTYLNGEVEKGWREIQERLIDK